MPQFAMLFSLNDATVVRPGGEVVLRDITWGVRAGEVTVIVGPTASGKTTLLETLLGRHRLSAGSIDLPTGRIGYVSFKEDSRQFRYAGHYYQQRFEFADADEPLLLVDYLRANSTATDSDVTAAARLLGVEAQLQLSFMKLSNGQTRRARIARALLQKPDWLFLDDPFMGLDLAGRETLIASLGELARTGTKLLLVCPADAIPHWATHVLALDAGRVQYAGERQSFVVQQSAVTERASGAALATEAVVELHDVTVRHGGKAILSDVNWTVRRGERWALIGPNGAGKTTLLSLICGDHPQAFSNDVRLFGTRRGHGETIWDVKRRIGFVSPEFHLYFTESLSGFEAAATGFHDTLLYREPTATQADAVRELFAAFHADHLQDRAFRQMSTGQQRVVLLVRALVKRPPMLILDEPFQGFDTGTTERVRAWLDANLTPEQTLIFVAHNPNDVPRTVAQTLRLHEGRVSL